MHALREALGQLGHLYLDGGGRAQRIGAGRQRYGDTRGGVAIILGGRGIAFRAQFDAGNVAQRDLGAGGAVLQEDGAELVGRGQARLRRDGGVERGALDRRQAADLTGRNLGVLGFDGRDDVIGRQIDGRQLFGIEPDAHGVLATEQLDVADAVDARNRVFDVRGDIVRNIGARRLAVVGIDTGDHQEAARCLRHGQARLLHDLRQESGHGLQLVLHLDLGDVRIGAGLEGDGDRGDTGRVAGRAHIHQAVEALHVLLDDLGDAILDRLGRGARIGGGDAHLGQGDVGILGDR